MIDCVCVYCASSNRSPKIYLDAAARLGRILAENGITVVYGGSRLGSMGRLAAAALEAGGKGIGGGPRFLGDLEWGHGALTDSVHAVLLGEKVTSVFEYAIRTLSRMEDVEHTRYLACYIFRY